MAPNKAFSTSASNSPPPVPIPSKTTQPHSAWYRSLKSSDKVSLTSTLWGIASDGPVRSILLISQVPAAEVSSIAMDDSSRTSVALARIILAERYRAHPTATRRHPSVDEMLTHADAALIIGDPALHYDPAASPHHVYDLGTEWQQLTGLPMVYALWAGPAHAEAAETLHASYHFGRAHLEEIIALEAPARRFSPALAREYLTRHIEYCLTPRHAEGMALFPLPRSPARHLKAGYTWSNASFPMSSDSYNHALGRAAHISGVEPEFWDIFGNRHVTSPDTNRAIVSALGLNAETEEALESSLSRLEQSAWTELAEPCLVVSVNRQPIRSFVNLPARHENSSAENELRLEDGTTRRFTAALAACPVLAETETAHARYVRKEIVLPPDLPLGYHSLNISIPHLPPACMRLIVTPDRAYLPPFLEAGGRSAGIAVTLYGLRTENNWGCGDFRDLRTACEWAARIAGVSFLALNPLHAIHNRQPYNASPYLPNSIFYRNPIYLDVEAIEDFQHPKILEIWNSPEVQQEIRELRATPYVEYERVQLLKLRFLRLAYAHSQTHPDPARTAAFEAYCEREGDLLHRFATYCSLDYKLHSENPDLWVWTDWPEPFREPDSPETLDFQAAHPDFLKFFKYIQWQLERQLSEAQKYAKSCGMAIGLYHDLALATDRCGSDLWAHSPFFVNGCRVGSPPDDFSPDGQDWAFPPPNKNHHRATGYRLFVESIRKTCSHGGALRIDHVMRFFRLFWIPDGGTAASGTYVRDRWEDLIRILALESVRNKVLVVGEDLGTVEPEVRENLARFGILSYRLFYFERQQGGAYKHATDYPRQALVSSTTHDLPTIAGFWVNEDIEARRRAGLLDDNAYQAQLRERLAEKQKMLEVLFSSGLLPPHVPRDAAQIPELSGDLHNAVIGFLASTPSMLLVVNQEDLSKETAQQNLPGTTDQHPNWSRKMKYTLEELRSDPQAKSFVAMLRYWLERTGRYAEPAPK